MDLKHYRRQVMMMAQSDAEELEGWRGEIRESEAGLTEERWAELEELDEDERAELAELAESDDESTEEDLVEDEDEEEHVRPDSKTVSRRSPVEAAHTPPSRPPWRLRPVTKKRRPAWPGQVR